LWNFIQGKKEQIMVSTMHVPQIKTISEDEQQATFVLEPLHRGFGITIGNSLRRVLMSSLEGAAVTAFKAEGVSHEFSTLDGVKEDVVQISLNLKQLRFRVYTDQPQTVELVKKGKGVVKAGDIANTADVEVVNPELVIATLDNAKASLNLSLKVEKGRGYMPVEERPKDDLEIGMIAIDSLFSPIKRVRYHVDRTRVGQVTDLDKLTIEITTDGSVAPADAMRQASVILMQQLTAITGDETPAILGGDSDASEGEEPAELNFGIEDLSLSPRTTNALVNNDITNVRDLLNLSDNELKSLKGFGARAYNEVVDKLKELELR
jgi:DNA-directed RNA polymerase subunit alpha